MQTHQLQPKHKPKDKKRVGRGGKKGTYSGRGNKGQSARAGRKMVPIIREVIKKYPKLKGYRRHISQNFKAVVSLKVLDEKFADGETVNPLNILNKGIIEAVKGRIPKVKILGDGGLKKKLTLEGCEFSESAKVAIEKAGGTIKK